MPMAMDQQQKSAAAPRGPDGGAATKRGVNGGRLATRGADGGSGNPSSTFRLLAKTTLLLLLLLNYPPTTHGTVKCYTTQKEKGNLPKVHKNIDKVGSGGKEKGDWCFLLYNVAGQADRLHTYVAGSSKTTFDIEVGCRRTSSPQCQLKKTGNRGTSNWRLDFVCCCNTDGCNDAIKNNTNPRVQFEKELNSADRQICRVDYAANGRIDDCSRLTNQTESNQKSKCHLFLENGPNKAAVLGCAHDDNNGDQCSWTTQYKVQSGVCRKMKNGDVKCCCEGKFCNGADYMDMMTCSAKQNSGVAFTYDQGNCKMVWSTITTSSKTDAARVTPTNKENTPGNGGEADTTTTTDSGSSSTLLIVILVLVAILVVLVLVGLVLQIGPIFVSWRKRRAEKKAAKADVYDSKKFDNDTVQPREIIDPAENAAELKKLGHQAADTSLTINPNEGSDFGDNTAARGGVFDEDTDAGPAKGTDKDKGIDKEKASDKAKPSDKAKASDKAKHTATPTSPKAAKEDKSNPKKE